MKLVFMDLCRSEFIEKYYYLTKFKVKGQPDTTIPMDIEDFYDNVMLPFMKEFCTWRAQHIDGYATEECPNVCNKLYVQFKLGNTVRNGRATETFTLGYVRAPIYSSFVMKGEMYMTINMGTILFHRLMKYMARDRTNGKLKPWDHYLHGMLHEAAQTIAHEFVHAEQYAFGRLRYDHQGKSFTFNGLKVSHNQNPTRSQYLAQPWEVEAHARQTKIVDGWEWRQSLRGLDFLGSPK